MNELLASWLQHFGIDTATRQWLYWLIMSAGIAFVVYVVDQLCKRVVIPMVKRLVRHTRSSWDDIFFSDTLLRDASRLVSPLLLAVLMPVAFTRGHAWLDFLLRVNTLYLVGVVAKLLCSFISSLYDLSEQQDTLKSRPLKGVYQMLKIVVICIALIVAVSVLIDKNPGYILTALGASAAVLMLVFKDTIMGLVAGVQLSANDMLRPGDWI